jgi:CheY-like chemotaxis protein
MKNNNVLVVDDDEAIIKLFQLVGKKLGLNIITADNGMAGFKAFSFHEFFMAIVDLKMPKMDGVELIEAVRKVPKYRNFPFLIISANMHDFDSRVAFLDHVDIREKLIKKEEIHDLFKKKLLLYDDSAKTISEADLLINLIKALKAPSDLLLNIVTKDKPDISEEKIKKDIQFLDGDFFLTYPTKIGGHNISFIFSFDKNLALHIKYGVMPGNEDVLQEESNILLSLKKALYPLLKKVFDEVGHLNDFDNNRLSVHYGTQYSSCLYTFDYGTLKKHLKILNKYGAMSIYLVYEN